MLPVHSWAVASLTTVLAELENRFFLIWKKKKKVVHCLSFDCVAAASGAAAVWGRRQHSQGATGGTLCSANTDVGDAGEAAARERAAGTEGRWPLFYFCLGEQLWKDLNPKACV